MAENSLVFLAFIAFWCGIGLVLSLAGGWWRVARQYRAREPALGKRFWLQYGNVGGVAYSGVLMFTIGRTGMRVSLLPPFRAGHAPIFVPWEDISAKRARMWSWHHVELRFSGVPDVPFRISRVLANNMTILSEGRFEYELSDRGL